MKTRKAHKIWLRNLRGFIYPLKTVSQAFEKAKSWYFRSSRRNGTFEYIREGHFTEDDKNTYARLRRRGRN